MLNPVFEADDVGDSTDAEATTDSGNDVSTSGADTAPVSTSAAETGSGADDGRGNTGGDSVEPTPQPRALCPAVEPPLGLMGLVVDSTEAAQLPEIVARAQTGTAILLEPGLYRLDETLVLSTPGIYLGAASHSAGDVELDGGLELSSLVVVAASDVTIANLTFTQTSGPAIDVNGSATADTVGVELVNLIFRDVRRAVFARPSESGFYSDKGTLACSTVRVTDLARAALGQTCEIAGYTNFGSADWTVRDSLFDGLWCRQGTTAYAIGVGAGAQGAVIERNRVVNASRGIRLGRNSDAGRRITANPPCGAGLVDVASALVANNIVAATDAAILDSEEMLVDGIAVWQACGVDVAHNTVYMAEAPRRSAIEYRWSSESIWLLNNLMSHTIEELEDSAAVWDGNTQGVGGEAFVDPAGGDFHLGPQGAKLRGVGGQSLVLEDIDGEVRADPPNAGADEI